jgi:hypothetical protein
LTDILWLIVGSAVSIGFVLLLFWLLDPLLKRVLSELVGMPSATAFYSRIFLVWLLLIGIAGISTADFGLATDMAPMEYVWGVADFVSDVLGQVLIVVGLILATVTILLAALRQRSE